MNVWKKSISGRGNRRRKGPEAGIHLRNRKKATVAEAEWVRARRVEARSHRSQETMRKSWDSILISVGSHRRA